MGRNGVDEDRLRRWLTMLRRPDQLSEPDLAALLKAHGKYPAGGSAMAVGQAAVDFLVAAIEQLRPDEGAGRDAAIPYLVLTTTFVKNRKLYQAAGELGMSTRQLTRERSRAIQMLVSELQDGVEADRAGARRRFLPEPIPSILVFMPRPAKSQALRRSLEEHRLVHVHGPPGIGKTALVAELAHHTSAANAVLWHRFRHGVNDTLASFLFELGQHLRGHDTGELAGYLSDTLPRPDLTVATRLALQALADQDRKSVV